MRAYAWCNACSSCMHLCMSSFVQASMHSRAYVACVHIFMYASVRELRIFIVVQYVHASRHTSMHQCMYVHMYTYIFLTYFYTCVCVHAVVHACVLCIHAREHAWAHACMSCVCACTILHVCMH